METVANNTLPSRSMRQNQTIQLPDGRILSYAEYGPEDGIPIIMHHGSPGSRISTDEELYYRYGIRMINPERSGYGNSSINQHHTLKSWADDVTYLLNHLSINKAQVAGASGGGLFTLGCLAYKPKIFYAGSLIASVAPADVKGYKRNMSIGNYIGFLLMKYLPALLRWGVKSAAAQIQKDPIKYFDVLKKQLCKFDQEVLEKAQKENTLDIFIKHVTEAYKNGIEGHLTDMELISKAWEIDLKTIEAPVTIFHGEEDALSPVEGAKFIHQQLPNSQAHFIPGAGHLLTEDEKIFEDILIGIKGKSIQN